MIDDTLKQLEEILKRNAQLSDTERSQLLDLTQQLKSELGQTPSDQREKAQSVANFAKATISESLRVEQDEKLKEVSEKGLQLAVRHFEATHPGIVATIESLLMTLSTLGI